MGTHLPELVGDPPPFPVQLGLVAQVQFRISIVFAVADVRELLHPPLAPREVPKAAGLLVQLLRICPARRVSSLGQADLLAVFIEPRLGVVVLLLGEHDVHGRRVGGVGWSAGGTRAAGRKCPRRLIVLPIETHR